MTSRLEADCISYNAWGGRGGEETEQGGQWRREKSKVGSWRQKMQGQGREGWKQWEAEEGRSIAVASVVSLGFAHISHLRPTATLKVHLNHPLWMEKVRL